ncbi:LytR family transcriptional regulator [Pradoshia sp. D12]|uniref:LCP family protein n=1 Tax=Bacillaceae TaxID=186817 RepID=UPI00112A2961|nr:MULTISPECIES: LCP family protein [Bacillaceae]QFK72902.1 LytR family transcriptional regulator [Pradoshia sp. D12]TPF71894.1 LytR family transcriptional regulator [Bacillus sp. D12]
MQNRQNMRKVRRRRKNKKRIAAVILFPILIVILVAGGYAGYLYVKAQNVLSESYDENFANDGRGVNPAKDNVSVLFMGVDDSSVRNNEKGSRTDALMLATFNDKEKTVKLLSIPRDSYVYIPGKDNYSKITHAHAYGGVKYTIDTVEELLDVPVDYYVKMNFNAFVDVVDALEGIEVNVPYTFSEQNSNDEQGAITLEEGLQTLNGEEALALARTRKKDSDIERGKRQQEILTAIIDKAASAKSITKYADVIEGIGKNMKTNMTFKEMKSFSSYVLAASNLQIESISLEGKDSYIGGTYYYQLDEQSLENIKQELQAHLDYKKDAETDSIPNDSVIVE